MGLLANCPQLSALFRLMKSCNMGPQQVRIGQKVRFISGSLEGVDGTVLTHCGGERVLVELQRGVYVEVVQTALESSE